MKPGGCEEELLRALAEMPFLDRLEMVAVSGWSRGAVYEAGEAGERRVRRIGPPRHRPRAPDPKVSPHRGRA